MTTRAEFAKLMRNRYWRAYAVGTLSLVFFHIGLILFAWTPLFEKERVVTPVEWAIIITSSFTAIILLTKVLLLRHGLLSRWAYLISASSIALCTAGFVLGDVDVTWPTRLMVLMLLISGGLTTIEMHIQFGGPKIKDGNG